MTNRRNNLDGFRSFPLTKSDAKGILVSHQDLKDSEERHEKQMNTLNFLLTGVVIVLFVALLSFVFAIASMFLDNWRFHTEAYNNYADTVRTQGLLIELSNKERDELLIETRSLKLAIEALRQNEGINVEEVNP